MRNYPLILNLFVYGSQVSSSPLARVVMMVAPRKLADSEYRETRAALEKNGVVIKVAGVNLDICAGYGDIKVKPDISLDQASMEQFEALIIKNWRWETGVVLDKRIQADLEACFKQFLAYLGTDQFQMGRNIAKRNNLHGLFSR